jgi:hypothetical protein
MIAACVPFVVACFHPAARLLTDPAGDGSESKNFLILRITEATAQSTASHDALCAKDHVKLRPMRLRSRTLQCDGLYPL